MPVPLLYAYFEMRKDARNFRLHDWREDEKRPPEVLHFNVTDSCNARCQFCAYRFTRPEGVMPMDIFAKALKEYVEMGGKNIGFNPLVGEPLIDPKLFERLKLVSQYPLEKIFLFTNAIELAKDKMVEDLLSSGLDEINVSLPAFDKETFKRTMGVDRYEDAIGGLIRLLRSNEEHGRPLRVLIHLRGGVEGWFADDFWQRIYPLVGKDFIRDNMQYSRLFDNWAGQISKKDLPEGAGFYPLGRLRLRPCDRTFQVAVLVNGDLRACDCRFGEKGRHDELVFGNIRENSLSQLWQGERLNRIRRSFKGRGLPVCRGCNDYNPH